MRMPGMQGGEMLLEIKRNYPDIVSILLTAYTDREELAKAVKAGIFSFIPKPWEPEQLIEEVEKAIEFRNKEKKKNKITRTLNDQFKTGGEFQRETLHVDLPKSKNIRFSLMHLPAGLHYCDGDYYDIIRLDGERYAVLIGDVAGNALMGAFVTVILKSILYSEYIHPLLKEGKQLSPAALLSWLNRRLCSYLQQFDLMLVSFAAALIDTRDMRMTYSFADHTPFGCIRGDEFLYLSAEGTGLGIIKELSFKENEFELHRGDKLLFMSDGLAPRLSIKNKEDPLSQHNIIAEARNSGDFLQKLNDIILEEKKKGTFSDDVTLVSAELM
jgi:serine phosphatase RsbU (regulator of sigma subunit)